MITLRDKIDYESLSSSLNGRVIVTVVAYDLGQPSKSASADVQVQVEVSRRTDKMSRDVRKPTFWFPTWSNTNQAVQLQKMA